MMPQVLTSLLQSDLRLIGIATAVCLLVCFVGVSLFNRCRAARGRAQIKWLLLCGAASGFGVWTTHYIMMLAYYSRDAMVYHLGLKLLALVLAALLIGTGAAIALMGRSRWYHMAGGAVVGLGFAVMFYCDVMSLQTPLLVVNSRAAVLASIALSIGFSIPAAIFANRHDTLKDTAAAALLFACGILSLHITALGAMTVVPESMALLILSMMSTQALALLAAGAAAAILSGCLVVALADRRSHEAVAVQKVMLDMAIENMPQALCMFDENGRARLFNKRYVDLIGIAPEQLKDMSLVEILSHRSYGVAEGEPSSQLQEAVVAEMRSGQAVTRIDRTLVPGSVLRVTRQPLPDGGWVSTIEDITEWRKAQERISHLARHDALTDLPNRATFRDTLKRALEAAPEQTGVAVLYLDLDRFKEINDTLGHPVGDELLVAVSHRLKDSIRESDTVARLGGDEFAVVQIGREAMESEATALARRIVEVISAPYQIQGHLVSVGASVGIAMAPVDGDAPDELIKKADLALYHAKNAGRGGFRFFEAALDADAQARHVLTTELRAAVAKREFVLHYQPVRDLTSGAIVSMEALLRWQHPLRGIILPDQFLPLAEDCGLIVPIGDWVMRTACAEATRWPADVRVSVNLMPSQFRDSRLVPAVATALLTSGLPAERLELDISEIALLRNTAPVIDTLRALRKFGVRVSMDNFGGAYSKLNSSEGMLFDRIKIDRHFIDQIGRQDGALAALTALTSLGKRIAYSTTATGVETADQFDLLRAAGCAEIQGLLFEPPQPACDVRGMFDRGHKRVVA
jgi:diguanylate cyclase (GGDEF)-like protein/PAS domain S-box-containing protein